MHPKSVPSYFLGEKYSYKRLPMGIVGFPDIFQEKMSELKESLEYVRVYLDDLLCISKLSLEDHLDKLEEVLRQIRNAGLKVNAAKSTFCALEIEYLGYVLTRENLRVIRCRPYLQLNLLRGSNNLDTS
jgi:hypothetical protein